MAERKGRQSEPAKRGASSGASDRDPVEQWQSSDDAKAPKPSDRDAMGRDKRREVVGQSYGPTARTQIVFFVAVAAGLIFLVGGFFVAIAAFDQPPDSYPDRAPWSDPDAQEIPTRDPSGPCGEPGNAYPPPDDSPCATGTPTEKSASGGERAPGQEAGPGGVTNSGGDAGDSSG